MIQTWVFDILTTLHSKSGYFHHRGVFQTPQIERLPALFSVAEVREKVKSFQKNNFFIKTTLEIFPQTC